MKLKKAAINTYIKNVAPLAGARIEIEACERIDYGYGVAPLAGARIEILIAPAPASQASVAPLAGARIEIRLTHFHLLPGR